MSNEPDGYISESTTATEDDGVPDTRIQELNQEIEDLISEHDIRAQLILDLYYEYFARDPSIPTDGNITPPRLGIQNVSDPHRIDEIHKIYRHLERIITNLRVRIQGKHQERTALIQSTPPPFMEPPAAGGRRRPRRRKTAKRKRKSRKKTRKRARR
jgi:hypothetical protein